MTARNVQVVYSDPEDVGLTGVSALDLYTHLRFLLRSEAFDPNVRVVIDTGKGPDRHLPVYGIADRTDLLVLEL